MKKEEEKPETIDETLEKIKASGLYVSIIELSSPEYKEHCAYQSCDDQVIFSVEHLSVCQKHAISLMHCFIPDRKK